MSLSSSLMVESNRFKELLLLFAINNCLEPSFTTAESLLRDCEAHYIRPAVHRGWLPFMQGAHHLLCFLHSTSHIIQLANLNCCSNCSPSWFMALLLLIYTRTARMQQRSGHVSRTRCFTFVSPHYVTACCCCHHEHEIAVTGGKVQ